MARHIARGAAKDHAPGQIGRLAPQLAVDKVGAAPQAQGQRSTDDREVCQSPRIELVHAAHEHAADDAAHQATMKTHAALVGGKDLERMRPVVTVTVENDVEQAGANDKAKDHADHDARQVVDRNVKTPTALRAIHDDRREQSSDHIGQAVPVDGDGPRRNGDGIKHMVEVVEHIGPPAPYIQMRPRALRSQPHIWA